MNKHLWKGIFLILYSISGMAQENDSLLSAHSAGDSLVNGISCSVVDRNKILLQWAAPHIEEGAYFVVEHSHDGNQFEMVGAMKGSNNISGYDLTDNAPYNGTNFYRIKYADKAGLLGYSKTVEISVVANPSFRFYPNPVDKSLIIQIDFTADMEIINSLGTVLLNKQLQPGLQVVNVASLQKGNYFLRITDKMNNRDMMEHFLKN